MDILEKRKLKKIIQIKKKAKKQFIKIKNGGGH